VDRHPGARVYHRSEWIRIVAGIGDYPPMCLAAYEGDTITGVLPAVAVRSRLTGNRLCSLSFSDECFPLADDEGVARALLDEAERLRSAGGFSFFEMRGAPALAGAPAVAGEVVGAAIARSAGFDRQDHFDTFSLALEPDAQAVFGRLHKKAVRPTIKRAQKLGVTVREGRSPEDLHEFYRMYCATRRRHGVPPQPIRLFQLILDRFAEERCIVGGVDRGAGGRSAVDSSPPGATLYLAVYEGRAIGAVIVMHWRGTTWLKYEVVDDVHRELRPVYALLWKSIEDACAAGDHTYDFGRTERDNEGLAAFKSRWGTERVPIPYFFRPPGDAPSVADSSSLKYRLFTGTFRHLPAGLSAWIGARIFRHFG